MTPLYFRLIMVYNNGNFVEQNIKSTIMYS